MIDSVINIIWRCLCSLVHTNIMGTLMSPPGACISKNQYTTKEPTREMGRDELFSFSARENSQVHIHIFCILTTSSGMFLRNSGEITEIKRDPSCLNHRVITNNTHIAWMVFTQLSSFLPSFLPTSYHYALGAPALKGRCLPP